MKPKNQRQHGSKSKADLEHIDAEIKLMQANVDKAVGSLRQQEITMSQSRASVLGLVKSINQDSLGVGFADYIRAALRAFQYYKIHTISIDGPGKVDEEISRLETCANILESKITEDAVLGETGCGKTAFLSLLLNLFKGYGPFELEDENDERAESGLEKQETQTSDATLYTFTTPDGTEIQILDTPGLADTRGIQQDEQHKAKINKAMQEFVTTVDAVVIMANGTTERMATASSYTLNMLASAFPYSIVDNIAFIFTHCDSFTRNLDIASLPEALRKSNYWTLENPLAYHKKYQREVKAGSSESTLKEGRERLESIYKKTVLTLNEWLDWADARYARPTLEIKRLYQTMVDVEAQIEAAISLMTRLGERRRELQTAQHGLEDHRTSKSTIQALCNQTIEYWERVPDDKHNLICIAPDCYSNCHIDCSLPFSLNPADIGRHCEAFVCSVDDAQRRTESDDASNSLCCIHCPHEAREHRHYKSKHVKQTRALHPTAKADLAKAEAKEHRLEMAKRVAKEKLDSTQLELDTVQDKVNSLVDTYNSKCLNKNFDERINSAIQMMELRLEELKSKPGTEHAQGIVQSAIQKLKTKLDVLRKSWEKKSGVVNHLTGTAGSGFESGVESGVESLIGALGAALIGAILSVV
ncbi:unnamed protein product [Rhizoctonia solani]|uniref:AIG1-type G domain-containing protein n=1 Tax=Rhizoctonia solani TaxID=456999 RepID=A0A8H3BP57_9AGAM|nr:unnamed protein product [Rhizoctonia solani]